MKRIGEKILERLLPVILGVAGVAACGQETGFSTEDQILAQKIASDTEPDLYLRGKGTPAEFISNRFYTLRNARWTVRDGRTRNNVAYPDAVRHLADFYRELWKGEMWKEKPRRIVIPRLDAPPILDGRLLAAEWDGALRFSGEYRIGCSDSDPDRQGTRWFIGRFGNDLYIGVEFSDDDLRIFSGASFDEPDPIYRGDSLEVFIRPDVKNLYYREYLVNPHGKKWSLYHKASPFGQWDVLDSAAISGLAAGSSITPQGFCIEIRIPLETPEAECWSLMMVRSNRDDAGNVCYSTPVPLLYDPHNIYGYLRIKPAEH